MEIEYFPAESGCLTARIRGEYTLPLKSFERLLHSAIAPEQERTWFKPKSVNSVVFVFGAGLGYHLEFLRDLPAGAVSFVILCDAFPENLAIVKEKLKNLNVIYCGELQAHLPFLENRKLTVIRHPAASRYCEEEGENALRMIIPLLHRNLDANRSHSERCETLPIALPFGSHFLQQEILNALKDLDIPAMVLPQESENPNELEEILMKEFQECRPRLVLCINGKGIDAEGILINACRRFSIPLHIWFVDDPRPIDCLYKNNQCENIYAWTWERAYIPHLKQRGFKGVEYLPLAGDPHLFYPAPALSNANSSGGGSQGGKIDLLFTGSAMAGDFLNEIWRHITYDKTQALPIAENAAFQILTGKMTAADMPCETKEEAWFSSFAIHTASREKRRLCLAPLITLGLQFAGDSKGWRELFGNKIKTLPDVDYRKGLRSHYATGNIHINVTSCQMPSSVNQRVFDIPLCGRFVISDSQSDLFELFPDDAICSASSPEEYVELAKFHLSNPNAKNEITQKARGHILQEHTYKHRLQTILNSCQL